MQNVVRLAALAAALAFAAPAAAQQRDASVGIGIGLTDGPFFTGTEIFVPINVSPNLRIEPVIGIDRIDLDAGGGEASEFLIGAGVFWVNPIATQANIYVGGRLALNFASFTDAGVNPDEEKRRDFFLGPALGGEWLPHPRIAIGAEAMLGLLNIGDTETTDGVTGVETETPGGSEIATQGTVFVRVYLF
jgi:hypothetical protein